MADYDEHCRIIKCIHELGKRVEILREQALSIEREKEILLATLQEIQDNPRLANFSEEQRDDIDYNTERLVLRCLTVDVAVTTPRNESQELAYKSVLEILHNLLLNIKENPLKYEKDVISHLNACLPEPIDNSINLRFQDKILSCAADDQKMFRKRLEEMLEKIRNPEGDTADVSNSCSTELTETGSSESPQMENGIATQNGKEPTQGESDGSEEGLDGTT